MPVTRQRDSIAGRIVRAGLAVGLAHVLFKAVSVVQAIVAGSVLDRSTYDVVYAFAFEGCIFSLFLMGEEVIGPAFLPVFMRELDTRGEEQAWQFANAVLSLQLLLLCCTVFVLWLFPRQVVGLLTAWTSAAHPARFRLAALSVRWLAPSLICLSLGSTTYMLLNGYKRFFLAAFGDASWKFCLLAALGVGVGLFGVTYEAVLWGLLAGSIAKLATHLLGLRGRLGRLRFSLRLNTPAMRAMGALMLPLICGIVFAKVRDIFNNVTILSCLDTEGLMKANSLGRKLYVTIGWLVPYALSIAMFPFLCELVDREDHRAFARVLSRSCRMLLAVFIPLALVCAALSRPLSSLLFLWGRTSAGDVEWISLSMACYILVLPAAAVEYLLMQAFFAQRRMVSITVAGIAFSALSIAVSYAGIRLAGARGAWALAVVALGFTLSRTLKSVALVVLLKRRLQIFAPGETLLFLARCAAAGLAAAAAGYGGAAAAGGLAGTVTGKIAPLLQLGAGTAAAGAALLGALRLLRIEEPRVMCRWALERLRARRPASEA